MDWLARHFAVFPAPELVLVVGAGQGRELPVLTRFPQARLVLLEPQPRWAVLLRRQTMDLPRLEVLEHAIDDQSGTGTLAVFNFPELSSLHPAPSLTSLLPGARQIAQLPVETRSMSDLVRQLEVPANPNNWLIVDAPGIESAVQEGLADSDLRNRFGHIVLRTYHHGAEEAPLVEALIASGYRALGDKDTSDGDWPRRHFQYFDRSPQYKELETKIDELKARSKDLAIEKTDLRERLERQRLEEEEQVSKLNEQLRSVSHDADQRVAKLSEQLAKAAKTLDKLQAELEALTAQAQENKEARTAQDARFTEQKQQLAEASKLLQEQQVELDRRDAQAQENKEAQQALKARFEELKQQLAETIEAHKTELERHHATAQEHLEAQAAELKEQVESLDESRMKRISQLEGEIDQNRSDLSISLRLQVLRENDLKDLQERYADTLETRNAQHELLRKVRKRLSLAAEHLLQLKDESNEDRKNELTSELVEALAHDIPEDD